MKKIFKAVAIVTVFSILTRLLGFFFRVFLTRKIGAEGIGLYQVASSLIGILLTLVASGLPLTTAKKVAVYENSLKFENKNKVVTSSLIIAIIISTFCSLIFYFGQDILSIFISDKRVIIIIMYMLPAVVFSSFYAILRGAMWGKNEYFFVSITEFFEEIVKIIATFILLFNIQDVLQSTINTAIAFSISCFASCVLAIILYVVNGGKLCFKKGEYYGVLKSALPITGVRVASSILQPVISILVPFELVKIGLTNSEAMSLFGIIMGMTFPMLFVPLSVIGSLSMVLVPNISSLYISKDYKTITNTTKKSLNISLFIACIFVTLYLSVGDFIGIILYNNSLSGILLRLSSFVVLPIVLCNITNSILNSLNMEVKSFRNYILGGTSILIIVIIFTRFIGINAIILGFLVGMTLISILNVFMIKKALLVEDLNLLNTVIMYLVISILIGFVGNNIANIINILLSPLVTGILSGIISVILFIISAKILELFDFVKFVHKKNIPTK